MALLYSDNLERAIKLLTALEVVLDELSREEMTVDYPYLIAAFAAVIYGQVPVIKTQCEYAPDGVCTTTATDSCGGMEEAVKVLYEAIEMLHDEVELEQVGGNELDRGKAH